MNQRVIYWLTTTVAMLLWILVIGIAVLAVWALLQLLPG